MSGPQKRLFRSRTDRILGGVCGGLAHYFGMDPTLMRVIFVAVALGGGFGVALYSILWIVIPEEPVAAASERPSSSSEKSKDGTQQMVQNVAGGTTGRRTLFGLVIVFLGLALLTHQFLPMHWFRWDLLWPVLVIALGLALLLKRS